MDHEEIDQFDVIDRYLTGKLPVEESTDFEEHFINCPQCISRLQVTDGFIQGLRSIAVEQILPLSHHQPRNAFPYSLYALFRKPWVLACACLLIAGAICATWAVNYTRRLRAEADQAKSLSEQWQRRYESELQSATAADRKLQETEQQRAEQLLALEMKLKEEKEQHTKMEAESRRRMHTPGSLPVFALISVRSSSANPSEPINKIVLPRSSAVFAFSISLAGETQFHNYRISIFDDRHRLIEKTRQLTPDRDDVLTILLDSGLFRSGNYSLVLEGFKKEGGQEIIDHYPLRITKTR